jgi:hypothetical protein
MSDRNPERLIEEVLDAHGGMEYWSTLGALEAEISASGFLFTAKRRPVLDRVRVRASTREPGFTFFDFPAPGQTAELIGDEEVRITGTDGKIVASRPHPRSAFFGPHKRLFWDPLDFIYFGGYATWNYLMTPFLFLRNGFEFQELEPVPGPSGPWSRLRVTFPRDIPAHCRTQVFAFDGQRLLRRLDYTAEVVGSWARAAHLCDGYREFGRLKAPTRRRVRPLIVGNRPMPWPTLVALDIHDIRPISISAEAGRPPCL